MLQHKQTLDVIALALTRNRAPAQGQDAAGRVFFVPTSGCSQDKHDAIGGKVATLATRAAERDYLDAAAALARGYSVAQLTALALALDPGLAAEDFADAGQRLDRLRDDRFAPYGLTPDDVTRLRKRFAAWPRKAPPGSAP